MENSVFSGRWQHSLPVLLPIPELAAGAGCTEYLGKHVTARREEAGRFLSAFSQTLEQALPWTQSLLECAFCWAPWLRNVFYFSDPGCLYFSDLGCVELLRGD